MGSEDSKRSELARTLAKGVAYSAPLIVAVAGVASVHAILGDATNAERGYHMAAAGEAEGEAEGEAMPEAEGEAEGEGEGEAEGEGEGEGEAESR